MKNLFSFAALAALTMFAASCGNDEAEAKRKADSARIADSLTGVTMQWRADSTRMADSTARVLAETQRRMDSARVADSLAATKKGGSKPKPKPTVPAGEPKVGGRR